MQTLSMAQLTQSVWENPERQSQTMCARTWKHSRALGSMPRLPWSSKALKKPLKPSQEWLVSHDCSIERVICTFLYHLILAFMVLKALGYKTPIRYFVSLLKPCFHETWTHADCTAPALEFQNKSESWVVRVGNQFSAADAHRCFLAQQVHGSCTPTAAASVACQQQLEALANWWNQYASEHMYTQQVRVRQSPVASLLVATLLILILRIPRYSWQ